MKRRELNKLHRVIIMAMDVGILMLSYTLAFLVRYGNDIDPRNVEAVTNIFPYLAIFLVLTFYVYEMYSLKGRNNDQLVGSILISVGLLAVFTSFGAYFFRSFAFPRSIIIIVSLVQTALLGIWRSFLMHYYIRIRPKKQIMLVGKKDLVDRLEWEIRHDPLVHLEVKYLIDIEKNQMREIEEYSKSIDEMLIVCGSEVKWQESLTHYCIDNNIPFYILPSVYELMISEYRLELVNDIPVFYIDRLQLTQEQRFFKRVFDLLFASLALIVLTPLMLIIGFAIKVDSPGTMYFKQRRVTEGNREFDVYKFRTMVRDAETMTGPVMATQNDPRITRLGSFLRKTRLDEIPQFINVVRGEMSIVGPRPERNHFIDEFVKESPQFRSRLNVKAGITGMAQVYGKYSTYMADKLKYDLLYIRRYSMILDITIVLKTILVVFNKHQAEGIEDYQDTDKLSKK
jgi:exopolysaccharide biosynthesis polyprenyl glycosylphosphotransferase